MRLIKESLVAGLVLAISLPLVAQDAGAPAPSALAEGAAEAAAAPLFGMGLDLGFNPIYSEVNGVVENWQRIGLRPELKLGEFGIGVDIEINFRFNGGADGQSFEVRAEDWVVSPTRNFFELYLPKIRYLSWAQKGSPLFIKLGDQDAASLGNGFIVGGFNNTLHKPGQRVFGLGFDLDGKLFSFPWVGLETLVGNLAAWDLMGFRLFVRPAAGTEVPILEKMQIGFTGAVDTNPYYFSPDAAVKANPAAASVGIWGVDIKVPLVSSDLLNLNFLGDLALQKENYGSQIGLSGNAFQFLTYTGMIRFMAANFIPAYFNQLYDIQREDRLAVYGAPSSSAPPYAAWLVALGFNVLDGALYFDASLDGPFNADSTVAYRYPNLRGAFGLKRGVLGGLAMELSYQKSNIETIQSIVDPSNALIAAQLSFAMGPAAIQLVYNITYDPYATERGLPNPWQVDSRIETSIILFESGVKL